MIGPQSSSVISYPGNSIVAPQDGLECLSIWSEFPVDEDLVRTLGCMLFITVLRNDTIAAVKDPSRCSKGPAMTGILSVQHHGPALPKVKLDHVLGSRPTDLESDCCFQAIQMHKRRQFPEEAGPKARKVSDPALDILVCNKAILANEHEDMTMHLLKINVVERSWSGPATGGICELLAQHYIFIVHFGVTVNEVDSKSLMDIVLDGDVIRGLIARWIDTI